MQKLKQNQYTEIFQKLPAPIKDVVAASTTSEKIFKIAQTHRLQVDQSGTLNNIVLDVLMGITSVKNFLDTVKQEINLEPHEAVALVNDIDEQIFKPVREAMEKAFAGGAPYKPRTIATADENDDEHLHLTKRDVLKEIENPAESQVRKVLINNPDSHKEDNPKPENIPKEPEATIATTEAVEEYHEELTGNKIEIRKLPVEASEEAPKEEIKTPEPQNTEQKYQVDPYREPIE